MMKMPVTVMKGSAKRESGRRAQSTNIIAAKVCGWDLMKGSCCWNSVWCFDRLLWQACFGGESILD